MPKVAFLKGGSQYGVLRFFIDDLAKAFEARGYDTCVFDLVALENPTDIYAMLRQAGPLELVFSFSIAAEFRDEAGRTMLEAVGAPHVVQYVDHPLHQLDRLLATPRSTALLVVDESHARAVKTLLGPTNFATVGFGPHGASGQPCKMPADAESFIASRPIRIFFAASFGERKTPLWSTYPPQVQALLAEAAELALSQEWVPSLEALERVLAAHGMDPYNPDLPKALAADLFRLRLLAIMVDDWTRFTRRAKLLQAAGEAGLPLTLVGSGCEQYAARYKQFDCRGAVDFSETLALMRQSRIVLSSNANFGEGSHERPLLAMLAGAVAATDTSKFYTANFEDGRDIALYRWLHLDDDLAKIGALLQRPEALFDIARAGHANASAHHRWDNRIDAIIAAAQAVRQAFPVAGKIRD